MQRGAALIVSVIMLLTITMGALALMRSMETGNLLAGNLAFKRSATAATDIAAEKAIAYLANAAVSGTLNADSTSSGYYASAAGSWDMTGSRVGASYSRVKWDTATCTTTGSAACITPSSAVTLADTSGAYSYVMQRLCTSVGAPDTSANPCVSYKDPAGMSSVYYRITVRVTGPRNTRSFTETVVRF